MRLLPLILFFVTIPVAAEAAVLPVVAIREAVTVDTAEVTLGQVAGDMTPELAAVSLGSAPVPGSVRHISADYIRLRLRRCGIRPESLDLQGEGVTVSRLSAVGEKPAAGTTGASKGNSATVLIKRNQLVKVEVQCGGITIHTTGRTAGEAGEGDLVEVNLVNSNRKLTGRATGGTIIVAITGSMP